VLLDSLQLANDFLDGKGVESPRLDAEVLLAHVLGSSRLELYTSYDRPLVGAEVDAYRETLRRRAAREPVGYITGSREFWSLELIVDRRVLIPRPETELLVEFAKEALGDGAGNGADHVTVADIGTGSGAVAVAVAIECADVRVVATDRSAASLEVAPINAARHRVADRIEFVEGDLFEPLADRPPFELIVSNPPYVRDDEYETLAPEVRLWEPAPALVGGPDGMEPTRRLIAEAPDHLCADGWLAIEVGSQADLVCRCFAERGWRDVTVRKDLAGHDRVVAARRPNGAQRG
jgi:release factor glutamine methyltransferase